MSQENVEIVRAYIEDFNRGDWVAAGMGFMHDDVEIDWSRSPAPYRGIYRGREQHSDSPKNSRCGRTPESEASGFIDAGDDVLVPHVVHLRGRDGIQVKVRATYVDTMRDGLCVRWRIYQEHGDALEAAGLRE